MVPCDVIVIRIIERTGVLSVWHPTVKGSKQRETDLFAIDLLLKRKLYKYEERFHIHIGFLCPFFLFLLFTRKHDK